MRTTVGILFNFAICGGVILCLLNGCVRLDRGYPEKRYFVIDVSRGGEVCPAVAHGTLKIGTFPVSPQYEGRGFVYYKGGSMYDSDFYNAFFISPGAMLTEEVRQWLAASGLFRHVADLSGSREPTYFLGGRITALYGDYSKASRYFEKSLLIRTEAFGENHYEVGASYANIGNVFTALGDYDKALEYYKRAKSIYLKTLGVNNPDLALNYNNIGVLYDYMGDYKQSLKYYLKS